MFVWIGCGNRDPRWWCKLASKHFFLNVQIFPFAGCYGDSITNYLTEVLFYLNLSSRGHNHIGSLFTNEEQKKEKKACVVLYACATRASLVHDATDADCPTQNGSACGCMYYTDFETLIFNQVYQKSSPDITPSVWLGSEHQPTNKSTINQLKKTAVNLFVLNSILINRTFSASSLWVPSKFRSHSDISVHMHTMTAWCYLCVQCVGRKQSGQDVQHAEVTVVLGCLRSATAHAELCAELWVLHDVWSHRTQLAPLSAQHGYGR